MVANVIIAQLLFLQMTIRRRTCIFNYSPGGSVTAGLAVYDTMQFMTCDVTPIASQPPAWGGRAPVRGDQGKAFALPNANIMIHQRARRAREGQASDVEIRVKYMLKLKHL